MRFTICLTAAVAFVSLTGNAYSQTAAGTAPAAAPAAAAAPSTQPATFQLMETSWTYTRNGTKVQESVDAKGNWIANSADGKHLDHGTSLMKGDKACFTSLMTKEGELCWTTKPLAVGESFETVSNKGEKLTVTRVGYTPLSMPK